MIDFGSWRTTQAQDLLWSKYFTVWKENEDFKPDFLLSTLLRLTFTMSFWDTICSKKRKQCTGQFSVWQGWMLGLFLSSSVW